ncbi:hypothetical protein [Paenibacillus taichungensis]
MDIGTLIVVFSNPIGITILAVLTLLMIIAAILYIYLDENGGLF